MNFLFKFIPINILLLIYSKHVEDIYWNKFKKKVDIVGSYCANALECIIKNNRYPQLADKCILFVVNEH